MIAPQEPEPPKDCLDAEFSVKDASKVVLIRVGLFVVYFLLLRNNADVNDRLKQALAYADITKAAIDRSSAQAKLADLKKSFKL